ncbi:MAG: ShlB/FhaC/HecB family hemolysin secretion/activation protein [Chlamydiales bacterium]|nr:ShlB/FhaC/HecB family hemolysin secretion/activation protein [Chlamydiales bacterium]
MTTERFPFRPYIGGDNTGTQYTSRTRWFTGFYAGNLWGWDQQLSYQFTTASDPTIFIAHSANDTIPFPWRHQLYVYGGWSRVHGTFPQPDMKNKGINWQVSPRYQIPINPIYGNMLQEITIGYDFKRTNNGLIFGEETFSKTSADINQFMVGYYFDYKSSPFATSVNTEIFFSPAQLTSDQTDARYQQIRPFANDKYIYGRIRVSHTQYLPKDFSLKASLVGQGTGWNLMPSEQFGIGGYETVRGYEERGLNVDDAFLASLQIDAPATRLFDWRKGNPRQERLQFLAFIDYGWGALHHPDVLEKPSEWMLGIGPGVRYYNGTNLLFRADLGFPLHRAGLGRQGIHLHIGGTLSF